MNNLIKNVLIFAAGAGVGAVVSWKVLETKYKRLADEEIESVKESFSKRVKEQTEESKPVEEPITKPVFKDYTSIVGSEGYSESSTDIVVEEKKEDPRKVNDKPYVIAPEEFGEEEDYERISLTYYADDILADELDEVVDDVENTVGAASLDTFGDYEDDSVYVRNEKLKCDYEILLDHRNYSDVIKTKPRKWED